MTRMGLKPELESTSRDEQQRIMGANLSEQQLELEEQIWVYKLPNICCACCGDRSVRKQECAQARSKKEGPPLWMVGFGLTGMLKGDTGHNIIGFCSLDEEDTTGATWAKSKPQSCWGPKWSLES